MPIEIVIVATLAGVLTGRTPALSEVLEDA